MNITSTLESLLLISAKSLSIKKIAEFLGQNTEDISEAVKVLQEKYNQQDSGIQILENQGEIQLMTNPENAQLVKDFLKDDATGELSRPSLETLTIVTYRGPLTKLELEQIRGVNCTLILRNLLMRGLIKEEEDPARGQLVYTPTMDFLKFLGINNVNELPEYDKLHSHDLLQKLIEEQILEEKAAIIN